MSKNVMKIGEAATASQVSSKMIRYYESIGLIHAVNRTASGYRTYTDKDVQTLRFIKRSRDLGFSIDRIRTLLGLWENKARKSADMKVLAQQYIAELDDDIQKLQSIRNQLQHMAYCCKGNNRPDCPILDDLATHLEQACNYPK